MKSLIVVLFLLGWLLPVASASEPSNNKGTANLAIQFVDAYNQHDVAAMLNLVHDDVRYMYINNDEIYTETKDKKALAEFLPEYFKQKPAAQSKVWSNSQAGPFITQVEQALWTTADGQAKSQCSLSVYQVQAQQIINIWYHDVFTCPALK